MLSPRPLIRPEMRRTQSVHQMSSYALNIGPESGSDGEDSISDISLDTCFRFESGGGTGSPRDRDEQDGDNNDNDDDMSDDSDLNETAEQRRSFRNSGPVISGVLL
jgi:hypothetical protein